jgi:hypothetical protein
LAGKERAGLQLDTAKKAGVASDSSVAGEDSQEKTGEPGATPTSDEVRVVAAYLRRRSATVEAVRLRASRDLLEAVGRVTAAAGDGATPLS